MWEYAYALKSFHLLDGLTEAGSLMAFYERLAHILAQRTLARGRQGFYRAYLAHTDQLPYVRGQLKVRSGPRKTDAVRLTCRYQEHTADIPDNQILLYTLGQIARSQRCRGRVQATVRRAYHTLQGIATPHPYQPWDCIGRSYNRLNQDYQPLHALCRFFLEHSGPTHHVGDRTMMPFLVNMARLFELFVAQWLKAHLPAPWQLKAQERVSVGANDDVQFDIDLVLYDGSGRARAVLDTKYKAPEQTNNPDFNQIVTYAKAKGCHQAILIYPTPLTAPLDVRMDDLHVRSLTFALGGDLEVAGQQFIRALLTRSDAPSSDP
jgi:5-methylcytosine-specific restriction enzyme subunit McrC